MIGERVGVKIYIEDLLFSFVPITKMYWCGKADLLIRHKPKVSMEGKCLNVDHEHVVTFVII